MSLLVTLANFGSYFVALDRLAEARAILREIFQNGSEHDRDGISVTLAIELAAATVTLEGDGPAGARLAAYAEAAFAQ